MRGEDYSDFGSAVTGKIAGRFDFTDSFALRGNVSTGFRAPGLQQEFFTSTATNFISGVPFEVGTFPATSDVATTLGAQPLDAEESRNYSLGAVFRFGGFEATVDALSHRHRDRIVLSENLNTPQVAALIAPFGATVARFFINGVETRDRRHRRGRAIRAGHRAARPLRLHRRRQLERHRSQRNCRRRTSSTTSASGSRATCVPPVLFARVNTLSFENGTPDNKISLGADWSIPLGGTHLA